MEVWDSEVPYVEGSTNVEFGRVAKVMARDGGPKYYDEQYMDAFAGRYEEARQREEADRILDQFMFATLVFE